MCMRHRINVHVLSLSRRVNKVRISISIVYMSYNFAAENYQDSVFTTTKRRFFNRDRTNGIVNILRSLFSKLKLDTYPKW